MIESGRRPPRPRREQGFTLIEMMVAMIVGLAVLGSVYGALVVQSREFQRHRESEDVAETLRGATALLTSEIRHASPSRGDLYSTGAQSLVMRSFQTSGAICGAAPPRYGVWQPSGGFTAGTDDSALVYRVSPPNWNQVKVTQVWTNPGSPYVTTCAWSGSYQPPIVVQLAGDTAGLGMGSVIRGFQRVEYGMVQQSGRWYLGRRVGAATAFDIVTGPLRMPTDSGLVFHYYTSSGSLTNTPSAVARVDVILRAQSARQVTSGGQTAVRADSVTLVAYPRN
jgi:prepilin-type N-terminal cleavage/methylation domain-containing protein